MGFQVFKSSSVFILFIYKHIFCFPAANFEDGVDLWRWEDAVLPPSGGPYRCGALCHQPDMQDYATCMAIYLHIIGRFIFLKEKKWNEKFIAL